MSEQQADKWVVFKDFTFPLPDSDLECTLRYGNPTRKDLLRAAGILDAYSSLILNKTQKDRNMICKILKGVALKSKNLIIRRCSG